MAGDGRAFRRRSWLEVRWRQLRNPPPPVLRAVLASVFVAVVAGLPLLVAPPNLRLGAAALYVVIVALAGALFTWAWAPLPTGFSARRRSAWSAMLGLFAALPVAYLGLVVIFQVLRPM